MLFIFINKLKAAWAIWNTDDESVIHGEMNSVIDPLTRALAIKNIDELKISCSDEFTVDFVNKWLPEWMELGEKEEYHWVWDKLNNYKNYSVVWSNAYPEEMDYMNRLILNEY